MSCAVCQMDMDPRGRLQSPGELWLAGFTSAHRREERERMAFIQENFCVKHKERMTISMAMMALQDARDEDV